MVGALAVTLAIILFPAHTPATPNNLSSSTVSDATLLQTVTASKTVQKIENTTGPKTSRIVPPVAPKVIASKKIPANASKTTKRIQSSANPKSTRVVPSVAPTMMPANVLNSIQTTKTSASPKSSRVVPPVAQMIIASKKKPANEANSVLRLPAPIDVMNNPSLQKKYNSEKIGNQAKPGDQVTLNKDQNFLAQIQNDLLKGNADYMLASSGRRKGGKEHWNQRNNKKWDYSRKKNNDNLQQDEEGLSLEMPMYSKGVLTTQRFSAVQDLTTANMSTHTTSTTVEKTATDETTQLLDLMLLGSTLKTPPLTFGADSSSEDDEKTTRPTTHLTTRPTTRSTTRPTMRTFKYSPLVWQREQRTTPSPHTKAHHKIKRPKDNNIKHSNDYNIWRPNDYNITRPNDHNKKSPKHYKIKRPNDYNIKHTNDYKIDHSNDYNVERPNNNNVKHLNNNGGERPNDYNIQRNNDYNVERFNDNGGERPNDYNIQHNNDYNDKRLSDNGGYRPNDYNIQRNNDYNVERFNDNGGEPPNDYNIKRNNDYNDKRLNDNGGERPSDYKIQRNNDFNVKRLNDYDGERPNDYNIQRNNDYDVERPNDYSIKHHNDYDMESSNGHNIKRPNNYRPVMKKDKRMKKYGQFRQKHRSQLKPRKKYGHRIPMRVKLTGFEEQDQPEFQKQDLPGFQGQGPPGFQRQGPSGFEVLKLDQKQRRPKNTVPQNPLRSQVELSGPQLDMYFARGPEVQSMRNKGHLCERNLLIFEGPTYNQNGIARFDDRRNRRFSTSTKKFMLPACCNCCRKSVLGCQ